MKVYRVTWWPTAAGSGGCSPPPVEWGGVTNVYVDNDRKKRYVSFTSARGGSVKLYGECPVVIEEIP